jgi:uncharacterized membrane protein YkoI
MNPKRLICSTGAAVLVAGGLQAGVAHAQAITSWQDAAARATAAVGGGTVREVEFERWYGGGAWEVEVFQNGREVEVLLDASNGAVLRSAADYDGPGDFDGPGDYDGPYDD